jgi:ABC-type phosphate/phosphonate transport system substrate-binding protein
MAEKRLIVGAVAYDPKVVTIWDGFRQYFDERGLGFDYILYTNYERQVEAHFSGHIHIAWNSPLAWLQSVRLAQVLRRRAEAICMRDTDRDLTSVVIARQDGSVESVGDLKGKRIAVGAKDSPQATLIPLYFLAEQGLEPNRDFEVVEHDTLRGKHGDHIGGERDAVRALVRGDCDAACLVDANQLLFVQEGVLHPGACRVIAQTPPYDHCNFTVLDGGPPEEIARFRELLLNMSYGDPQVRRLLDLEGLKRWLPGRTEGYAMLSKAIDKFGVIDEYLQSIAVRCA